MIVRETDIETIEMIVTDIAELEEKCHKKAIYCYVSGCVFAGMDFACVNGK